MSRPLRFSLPGLPQHVTHRGNNRCAIFASPTDYEFYRICLGDAAARYRCSLHAYVLMGNHVHLLITPQTAGGVSKFMQSVARRYVLHFNSTRQRTGTMWEGRYRATIVDTDRYLFSCYRYIELNPVRAGLVREPAEYRWSSYGANAFGRPDELVTPHDRYRALGASMERQRQGYRALFGHELEDETLLHIREATNTARPLGGPMTRRGELVAVSSDGVI